jgi:hypothetical protein
MRIPLPDGDELIPDAEFLQLAGGVTYRTGWNWDREGCPYTMIGGKKYRPLNEGLAWLASRIKRRNPRRAIPPRRAPATVTLPPPDSS